MRIVDFEEIKDNEYNLNISRYIDTSEEEELVDIPAVLSSLGELGKKEREIDARIEGYLKELGLC